jgi:hypothetical protein
MKSHTCDFSPRALFPLVLGPVLPLVVFAVAMQVGARTNLLPAPRPTLDTERAVLIHQAEATRSPQDAEVILLGDSSCLMNVSARQLGDALGRPVLNLGTFSFLDVNSHAAMLREYSRTNPGRLRAVVVLMHAETLRRLGAEEFYTDALEHFWSGKDHASSKAWHGQLNTTLGVDIFKGRLLARTLPLPLGGAYGRRYGFTADLERHLSVHRGSAIDPDPQPLTGSPEYRLAKTLEKASKNFRSVVPDGAKLFVGITPAPERFSGANYPALRDAMLAQWSGWIDGVALTNLPATMPDSNFVRTTHLTEPAISNYTAALSAALSSMRR